MKRINGPGARTQSTIASQINKRIEEVDMSDNMQEVIKKLEITLVEHIINK